MAIECKVQRKSGRFYASADVRGEAIAVGPFWGRHDAEEALRRAIDARLGPAQEADEARCLRFPATELLDDR